MAASRHDRTAIPLPSGWGEADIGPPDNVRLAGPRSYAHGGDLLRWFPADDGYSRRACDIENNGSGSEWMARRFDCSREEFLARWVCTEVLAKLHGIPVFHWLRTRGLFCAERESAACRLSSFGDAGELLYVRGTLWGGHAAFGRCAHPPFPTNTQDPTAGRSP